MRTGIQRRDGTVELSKRIADALVDYKRYIKHQGGMSALEIAEEEQVGPERIAQSIKNGRAMYEADEEIRLRDLKYSAEIDNEKAKRIVRKRIANKIADYIEKLLDGKRQVVETNKVTGEITVHDVFDPALVVLGLEQFRKATDFDRRPAPQNIFNFQQNNNNLNPDGISADGETSYEEQIQRIRQQQDGDDNVIDAEITSSTPAELSAPVQSVEAELVTEDEEALDF